MRKTIAFLLIFNICSVTEVFAHPVNYKKAWAVMPLYEVNRKELEVNYTYDVNQALGVNVGEMQTLKGDVKFYMPQFNYKLYRRNELNSQANLYGMLGAGVANNENKEMPAVSAAMQADYETRRIYTLLSTQRFQSEDGLGFTRVRYRFGAAPYLANFNDLNTWIIAQVDYASGMHNEWTFTPTLRFFYSNYLLELGVTHRGDVTVAAMFHFK